MKTFITSLLLLAVLLTIDGCSKDGKDTTRLYNNKKSNNYVPVLEKGSPEHLTAQSFKTKVFNYDVNKDWKYEGELPCIVDFYADWCGPCKQVAPILSELSEEYKGKIVVYKVDTDKEQELASVFGIQSIPSILFVPKKGQPDMTTGGRSKADFVKIINEKLINSKN